MRNLIFIISLLLLSFAVINCNRSGNESSNATSADSTLLRSTIVIDDMPPGRGIDTLIPDTNAYYIAMIGRDNALPDDAKVVLVNSKGTISGTIRQDEKNNYAIISEDGTNYPLTLSRGADTLKTSQMKLYYVLPVTIDNETAELLIPETQLQRLLKKE